MCFIPSMVASRESEFGVVRIAVLFSSKRRRSFFPPTHKSSTGAEWNGSASALPLGRPEMLGEKVEHHPHALTRADLAVNDEPQWYGDRCHLGDRAFDQRLGVADFFD